MDAFNLIMCSLTPQMTVGKEINAVLCECNTRV